MKESCDGVIYIRCDPDTSFRRITERNREEEKKISLEYIKRIHQLHEQWLVEGSEREAKPIKIVDGNRTTDKVFHDTLVAIKEIVKEMEEIDKRITPNKF